MMAAGWLAPWVAILLILAGGGESDRVVELTLAPVFERDSLRALKCEVRFQGEEDGETRLVLPDAWGGARDLWANLRDIAVEGPQARLADGDGPATRVIHHAPGAKLRVHYLVVPAATAVPTAGSGNDYRPIVQPGYFHTIGYTLWSLPEWSDQTPVRFTLRDLPKGWSFASDLEHGSAQTPLPMGAVRQSILVGGDFRVLGSGPRGMRLAIRGKWTFRDQGLFDVLAKVADTQRRYFRDPTEPYLVTVLPLAGDSTIVSAGGTGLGDAFAYFATANVPQSTMDRTLVHEHLHTWVPARLGRMPSSNEIGDYWFSEGFTDFLTLRLLVRDGTWDLGAWVRETDRILGEYGRSPVCEAPNSRIMEAFWSDPDVRQLAYQRGFLLAMNWDAQLRARSKGARDLDDVLIAMRDSTRAAGRGERHATDRLIEMLERQGLEAKKDVERHVTRGERIRWPESLFGPQARVHTEQVPEFTRGFDIQATVAANRVITGVDTLGPAYAAGMRNGMRLVKRESGVIGDSRTELAYRVSEGGSERVIGYLPAGPRRFEVQRVAVTDSSAAGQAALRKVIGGD